MTWRRYLQSRTRNAAFLWQMSLGILLAGVFVGAAVDRMVDPWIDASPVGLGDESDDEPGEEPLVPKEERLKELAKSGQWAELWWAIPGQMVDSWRQAGPTFLALLTGACWLAFSMQAIQPRSRRDGRLWLPLVALGLGVLSIWPTVFLIYFEEQRWGMVESANLAPGLRYFILGVGLREEASKFVCFLPLLPWCVWRRDELAALVLAGCVGLGFAMEENVNHIANSLGTATLTRLLMPAPFHMALTGLAGLAAYRACLWPKDWGPMLLATFGVVVLAHGSYDALAALPDLAEYSLGSLMIFVGAVYQYFRELRPKQALLTEPISQTANFLFCVSLTAAATFVYLCAALGAGPAAVALAASIVSQGVVVYLFLREMPETLVEM